MGSVWAAEHLGLKTDVAVKFIDNEVALRNANTLARFELEAKIAATLKSPHVVSVLDFGQDDERRPYLAMELLKGEELTERLERKKVLSFDEAKTVIVDVCKALQKAHAAGFVHRDLKPSNIFLCEEEDGFSVKLLDFGLAKSTNSVSMTGVNELLGTPDFMSPEQARGNKDIDFRTDFYSLGVVAFQCLTGRMPYDQTGSLPDLLLAITVREPLLASIVRPDLPAALVSWLARALKKDPKQRFASAKEMSATFVEACASRARVSIDTDDYAGEHEHTVRAEALQPIVSGEDPTISAGPSKPANTTSPSQIVISGEDPTLREPSGVSLGERPTLATPPPSASGPKASPLPPRDFKVETTMPLGVDPAAFAAAREALPNPKHEEEPPVLSRRVVSSGLPPFWVVAIALVLATGAVYWVYVSRH